MILDLESPKFSRHTGLDPASRSRNVLKRHWIPTFAGIPGLVMVIHTFGDYARFIPISLIQDPDVIRRILERLGLWRQDTGSRCKKPKPGYGSVVHEDFDDGWPGYEEPTITFH